jgi:hypothetical protein
MLTAKDLASDQIFDDTIATFPDLDRGEESIKHPLTYIPYRSLLPKGVENMLVACRAFSSDQIVNNFFNLIPHVWHLVKLPVHPQPFQLNKVSVLERSIFSLCVNN